MLLLKFWIFLATLVMEIEPPNGSGRPLVLMGFERWADNEVFGGNVELDPFLLVLTLELLVDNLSLVVDIVEEFEGVPVSLFRDELWLVTEDSPLMETVVGVA